MRYVREGDSSLRNHEIIALHVLHYYQSNVFLGQLRRHCLGAKAKEKSTARRKQKRKKRKRSLRRGRGNLSVMLRKRRKKGKLQMILA